jgi:hypothetical protein
LTSRTIEIVLLEDSSVALLQTLNGLAAQYRKDYVLTDLYLNHNKGKVIFTEKQKESA